MDAHRRAIYDFLRQPAHARLALLTRLGLLEGCDTAHNDLVVIALAFRRARLAGRVAELVEAMGAEAPAPSE